jgi:hypothetical protein
MATRKAVAAPIPRAGNAAAGDTSFPCRRVLCMAGRISLPTAISAPAAKMMTRAAQS